MFYSQCYTSFRRIKLSLEYLNVNKIPDSWKKSKDSIHSLHKICSRICSLPPSMPRYFIKKYSSPMDIVLDSFSGKGTVPLEACLNGRIGIGIDASPEAFVVTHAKVKPVTLIEVEKFLSKMQQKMEEIDKIAAQTELDKNAKIFYSKSTFEQILKIRKILSRQRNDAAIFTKALMCGILHGNSKISLSLRSSHSFSMSPTYVKEYSKEHKLKRPKRDVINCLLMKANEVLKDDLPKTKGIAFNGDAKKLNIENNSVDLVVTSPPYFNLGTYAWNNWLRLWFLNYNYKEVRKNLVETGSKEKYRSFMEESFQELERVLKPNSHCYVIVGDVKLKNRFINTAAFLAKVAKEVGFDVERIINDSIPKSSKHFIYLKKNEGIKRDRILCLKKVK